MQNSMGTPHEKETRITANTITRPTPGGRLRWFRRGVRGVVLAGLSLLVAACGDAPGSQVAQLTSTVRSATQSSTARGATDKYAASLAYSRCMRSHRVLNFPDPRQVAGGIQISDSQSGMDPHSPVFMSAERSCRHLLPGGGRRSTHAEQQRALARMLHSSQCMRGHGISGFPDPMLAPPANRAAASAIMSNGVAWLAIPNSIDVRSPAFERAAAACNLGLS
jgi:hypothetical protein